MEQQQKHGINGNQVKSEENPVFYLTRKVEMLIYHFPKKSCMLCELLILEVKGTWGDSLFITFI